jgi:uncharacterized protein
LAATQFEAPQMIRLFQAVMPKEARYFDLFDRHAATLVQGSRALRTVLDGGPGLNAAAAEVMKHEEAADEVAREVLLAVRRTFITPFDRSDIKGLTNSLDDAIDQMQKTAKTIQLFDVAEFAPKMREMGDIIVQSADQTVAAVAKLRDLNRNSAELNAYAERIVALEGQADALHDEGLKALFQAGPTDAMGFIIGREIYSHLEKVMDRFEDVANRVSGILIEHL